MATKQYLDLEGLKEFKSQLLSYYSGAASTDATARVGYAATAGVATTAAALAASKNFSITGDVTAAAVSFDGSGNVELSASIADAVGTGSGSKGLMTAAQAVKLEGIATGAEVNYINGIATASADLLSVTDGKLAIDLSDYATLDDISAVFKFRGSKANVASLPSEGMVVGDVWHITETGTEYVYVKEGDAAGRWEELGLTVSLSGYATETWVSNNYVAKVEGSSLMTDAEHTKLEGIEAGAQVNIIETVKVNGTALTPDSKAVNIAVPTGALASKDEVAEADLASALATKINGKVDAETGKSLVSDTLIAKLSSGSVTDGNESFVTGDQVYDAINAMPHENTTYTFTSAADGEEGQFKVKASGDAEATTITVNADKNKIESITVNGGSALAINSKSVDIDLSSYTAQALVTDGVEPVSSAAVLAAGYAKDSDIQSIPVATVSGLFSSSAS